MSFILDYLGIIAVIFTALLAYKKIRSGWFSKQTEDATEEAKTQSKLQKWWLQSYIREIYIVRASKRKLACAVPWVGVVISAFFVYWYLMWAIDVLLNPHQPFEKLIRYDGIVKDYVYHKKGDDILVVHLSNGEKKYFHLVLRKKEIVDTWLDKNITVWVQKEWKIIKGNYEWVEVADLNNATVLGDKAYNRDIANQNYFKMATSKLYNSIVWLFGFLALLWFINRSPVESVEILNKKYQ